MRRSGDWEYRAFQAHNCLESPKSEVIGEWIAFMVIMGKIEPVTFY